MKSIIIRGSMNAGKSTTIRELCKSLNPEKVWELDTNSGSNDPRRDSELSKIFNNTFIIKVNEKLILVCAGAPTEQRIKITKIIEICKDNNLKIEFAIVAMRYFEKRAGFNTLKELKKVSDLLLIETIQRINGDNFMETKEWKDRIEKLKNMVLNAIK